MRKSWLQCSYTFLDSCQSYSQRNPWRSRVRKYLIIQVSTLDPFWRQQREAWNPLAHHQWMSRLLRAPEEFAIKTIHPVPNAPFTKREPSIQKVKGYDKQGMLYACRTTSLQSWCSRLIQMAQKGVQYKDHDRRTRWSMWGDQGWRAAAESQVNRDVLFADYEIKKN